ncbi:MAG: hypothetical protein V4685_12975 [Bacteroidota bacterium]
MRKLLFISCVALLAACNNAGTTETKTDSTATAEVKAEKKALPEMPYTLAKPWSNWQPGDLQHAVTVMNSLKAWENGDIPKSMEAFGDSIEINFDNWVGKFSKDSLAKQFAAYRGTLASVTIKMEDWESVIAEDKSREFVTLWYKQITTDKKGKTDSIGCVNDARVVNGKVVELSETIRHFPAKK